MPPDNEKPDDVVTALNVDLSNCDRELIHMPGLIQPHGIMLVLRAADLTIVQASENIAVAFNVSAQTVAGKDLAELLGPMQASSLCEAIARAGDRLHSGPRLLQQMPPTTGRQGLDALAHRVGDLLILELEQVSPAQRLQPNLYADLADCTASLQYATGLQEFLDLAVTQVRAFSGFDRVMAYQFAEDGSGKVVAEARRGDLNAYLGLHFPASDIPAPARRMFALSWLRHLPDVDYVPVRLLPKVDSPVDMSRAILRHVSVMYSSYLKNMRVHATMVLPLMKTGQLWGLISCMHEATPLHVPSETRTAIEILARTVSSLMSEQGDRDTARYRERMQQAIAGLGRQMAREPDYRVGLRRGDVALHGWLDASGAALLTEDSVVLLGKTPTELEVRGIAGWLNEQDMADPVFATDRLAQVYPPAEAFREAASGLLAARLMRSREEFVMWFRPELLQTISWAGDPHNPVQVDVIDGEARLTPRTSFELWKEDVRGHSEQWLACEIEAAAALRQAIAEVVLIRLNEALKRSNAELDSFAYVASHDLKEPLRGIHNFVHFLQQSANAKLNEEERGRIQTILRLTQRMDNLTESLLQYSRVGQTEFMLETVDLDQLVKQALDFLSPRIAEVGAVVRTPRPLPEVQTDRMWVTSVLNNLILNAVKYNALPAGERWIEIGWSDEVGRRVFYVRDNGIGIAKRHLDQVFQIFRRLHARDEFGGGNGAGLTIARRTVERLGGRLWAESDGLGKGSTFLFTLGGVSTDGAHP